MNFDGGPGDAEIFGEDFLQGPEFCWKRTVDLAFFLQPLNYTLRFFLRVPKPKLLPTGFCKFSSVCETKTHVETPPDLSLVH